MGNQRQHTHKARILIVEDEAVTALDLEEAVKGFGHEVVGTISRGEDVPAAARDHNPTLVLMDIRLKGTVDGIQAAEELWRSANIPSIFLTSHTDEATLSRAKLTNPYGYVLKPYENDDLRVAIELGLHRIEQRATVLKELKARGLDSPIAAERPGVAALDGQTAVGGRNLKPMEFLGRVDPLNSLSSEALEMLAAHAEFRCLNEGEYISFERDKAAPAFLVASGRIAVMKASPEGKELALELIPPGDTFGLLLALDEYPTSVTLKAQRESVVLFFSRQDALRAIGTKPEVFQELLQGALEHLQYAHNLALNLAHSRAEVRISNALRTVMRDFGVVSQEQRAPRIDLTRLELSELAGTTPETAIRVTKAMERDGVLDLSVPGSIAILNVEALERMA